MRGAGQAIRLTASRDIFRLGANGMGMTMVRRTIAAFATAALAFPTPAAAQFGGLFKPKPKTETADPSTKSSGCDKTKPRSVGSQIMGSMLGGMASRTVGRVGGVGHFLPLPQFSTLLTDAIACRLDAKEQKQAADATTTAVRGGTVGSTSAWTSETRPGVSGRSTVLARTASADGTSCMSVNDVIIVNGEETTVPKRMCRAKGASGYTLAA